MIHHHHTMHRIHPSQINVSQPPPQPNMPNQPNQQRMNHHHYQQRINQQIQQQLPSQIHGNRSNVNGLNNHQHQVPPPIIPKQHLHQNIATLNQKPPHHVSNHTTPNSQIQPLQRLSYEKSATAAVQTSNNLKRESNTTISVPATVTLSSNNSSIVTVQPQTTLVAHSIPVASSHLHHNANLTTLSKPHPSVSSSETKVELKTPIVSANQETANSLASNAAVGISQSIALNDSSSGGENTEQGLESIANTKEKTPMCLVNELARFNKIQHQYRLISEQGPAHKKRFTVILKLGDEEYAAEGLSIKKAQHSAAKDAILKTVYKHPPLKTNRQLKGVQVCNKSHSGNITPTVELNALAMKRGEPTVYTVYTSNPALHGIPQIQAPGGQQFTNPPPLFVPRGSNLYQPRRGFSNQRNSGSFSTNSRASGHFNSTETFYVVLQVGSRTFSGMGPTQQAARHDAAARALEVLKPLTIETENLPNKITTGCSSENDSETGQDTLINLDIKSPISIVHEMALKRKLSVSFEVQNEKGPPHMKVYTTLCKVGSIVTEGEGNGKKLSKKKAAEKMVEELKKLPPLSPIEEPTNNRLNTKIRRKQQQQQQLQQAPMIKKKSRNLIKEKLETSGGTSDEINPISQLIQIQQARKEKEPVYTVIDERGTARRREFVIEVLAGGMTASGTGPNKKLAKKIAAENLLILMGIGKVTASGENSSKEKPRDEVVEKGKKVQFIEPDLPKKTAKTITPTPTNSNGRQIVPGILLVTASTSDNFSTPTKSSTSGKTSSSSEVVLEKSSTSPSSTTSNHDSGIGESGVSPRDQLNYLAQLIGFTVSYSDFPKGNHTEFLSLVTLSTDPPHMSHGSGSSVDESRDHAALKALSVLSELGLDNVKPKAK